VIALAVVALVAASGASSPAGAATTTFEPIEGFVPGLWVDGKDIDDAGVIVGRAEIAPGVGRAFIRRPGGPLTDLGALGSDNESSADALNDAGTVVGSSSPGLGEPSRAFVWTEVAGMADLGTLPGTSSAQATDINASGWIVGNSFGDGSRGWVRDPATGVLTDVGTLPGGSFVRIEAINDAGVAVGIAGDPEVIVPVVWTATAGLTRIPVPAGTPAYNPTAINDVGQVVGSMLDEVGDRHRSFVHDLATGTTIELGGFGSSMAVDIDDRGFAVGSAAESDFAPRVLAVWDTVNGTSWSYPFPNPAADLGSIGTIGGGGQLLATALADGAAQAFVGQLVVAPGPVTDLAFDDATCGEPTLSWGPPDFDGFGSVRYRVSSDGTVLAEISGTTFSDPRLVSGELNVLAVNDAGASSSADQLLVTSCTPPPTPVVVQPTFTG
jgi:probable HAF family extracellular repeat protein